MRAVVVDTHDCVLASLGRSFAEAGHEVLALSRAQLLAQWPAEAPPDVIILHEVLGLQPDCPALCRTVRARGDTTPCVISTTVFDAEQARRAFQAGCDDYVVIDSVAEFLMRLQVLLVRRATLPPPSVDLALGPLRVDDLGRVLVRGAAHELPRKELSLLRCLLGTPGEIVQFSRLREAAWQGATNLASNSLEVHVSRLRSWLRRTLEGELEIHALRGVGYFISLRAACRLQPFT